MTLYFLQVSAGIVFAWGIYRLVLQNRAAATTNRWFLLGGLILPFSLPLIPLSTSMVARANPILLPTISVTDAAFAMQTTPNSLTWMLLVYVGGVLAMALYHLSSFYTFLRILRSAEPMDGHSNVYLLQNSGMPFSFFSKIFLPKNIAPAQQEVIVEHEQWHIRQRHSVDVLLGMAVQTTLWFLPILPLYLRDLRKEHEYEVDQRVLKNTRFITYAETLLQVSLMPIHRAQFHSFSHSKLKHRIIMMTKTQKQNTWKLLMLLPLMGGMLYLNACNKQAEMTPENPTSALQLNEVDVPPQFNDNGVESTYQEKMGWFGQGIMQHVMKNMRYPAESKNAGAEGKVFVQFVIDANGKLKNAEVLKSTIENQLPEIVESMENAALDVFTNFPKIIPAQKDGKAIPVQFMVPINFVLEQKGTSSEKIIGPIQELATVTPDGC